ncbi:MAG: hypothetical protein IJS90_03565 [Clostridia bacterium]|nr:hypothetical protein [Clostridia bacterium]
MANNVMLNVNPGFPLGQLVGELTQKYQMEGYTVNAVNLKNAQTISFKKNTSGIKKIIGLSEGIKVNLNVTRDGIINASFSDADWIGKIIAIIVGLFFGGLLFPLAGVVGGIIGCVRQSSLSSKISDDITMIASGLDEEKSTDTLHPQY